MMTIIRKYNPFYTIFPISDLSYDDIRDRLIKQGLLEKYLVIDKENNSELIVFGTMGLKRENTHF